MSTLEVSGIVGSILSGILSDVILYSLNRKRIEGNKFKPIKIRMTLILVHILLLIISLHYFNFHVKKNVSQFILLLISSSFGYLTYGSISLLGVISMEFTANQFSGTSHSIASFFANVGAIFAGLPFSFISKIYSWNIAFKFIEYLTIIVLIFGVMFSNGKSYFDPLTKANKIRKDK